MSNDNQTKAKSILHQKMQEFFDKQIEVEIVNLCTSDGFNIYSLSRNNDDIEEDKVAAIASTLCSISNTSAEQISKGAFSVATVESENGTILFLRTKFIDIQSVLCVATSAKMSLGEARFHCQRLVNEITSIWPLV